MNIWDEAAGTATCRTGVPMQWVFGLSRLGVCPRNLI